MSNSRKNKVPPEIAADLLPLFAKLLEFDSYDVQKNVFGFKTYHVQVTRYKPEQFGYGEGMSLAEALQAAFGDAQLKSQKP